MLENSEKTLDIIPYSEITSPQKEEEKLETSSPILELPKNPGRFTQTAQAILEELRVRHRRFEIHGSAEIAPSLLLTVDKIWEVLQKEVHLPEIHKTEYAVNEALSELSDVACDFKARSVYFYPFLLKVENGITILIAMVAPQTKDKTDILPYRRACFRYSQELVSIILRNLAGALPQIEENKPGSLLIDRDESGDLYFYPTRFSFETDIGLITAKGFVPYIPIPIPDFITDIVEFAKSSNKLLMITPNYHIIIPNDSFVDTLLKHVVIQLDALANFVFHYIKKYSKENQLFGFLDVLDELERRMPNSRKGLVEGGWKIAYEFITLVHDFPFDMLATDEFLRVKESCLTSAAILEKLLAELQAKGKDIQEEKYQEILRKVIQKVEENTERNLVLTPVDIELELAVLFSLNKSDKGILINRLVDDLSSRLGCYQAKDENDRVICYSVDQKYLSDVMISTSNLAKTDEKYKSELNFLSSIRKVLRNREDVLLDTLSIKNEVIEKDFKRDGNENRKSSGDGHQLESIFNIPAGIVISLIGSVVSTIVSIASNDLSAILTGVMASLLVGIIMAYILKKIASAAKGNPYYAPKKSSAKSDSFLTIGKAAEDILFPKKYNNISEKIFDPKKLRYKIEVELEKITSLISPNDRRKDESKMISEIESAILPSVVMIQIPEETQIKGRARELIVSKADWKMPSFREKLAEHYRKEASVYKTDRDVSTYLNYIIKEIEFSYSKYLKL